jgi:hypothetical protein
MLPNLQVKFDEAKAGWSSVKKQFNILVLPFIPSIMFLGFFIGILGFVPFLTFPFSFICHTLVFFIVSVISCALLMCNTK